MNIIKESILEIWRIIRGGVEGVKVLVPPKPPPIPPLPVNTRALVIAKRILAEDKERREEVEDKETKE